MKIMFCDDGSDEAKQALETARQQAIAYQAEIWAVTSHRAEEETIHLYSDEIEAARKHLEQVKSELEKEKIPCRTYLLTRGLEAGEALIAFAKENKIDQIVIGIRNRSRVGKLLVGSVAQYIILKSECPVISV